MEKGFFDYVRSSLSTTYQEEWDDEVPFWGPLQRDVDGHELALSYIGDDGELIEFLRLYFSEEIVERVQYTLEFTKKSVLGGQYTKRGVYSSFVKKIISDIIAEAQTDSENIQTDTYDYSRIPFIWADSDDWRTGLLWEVSQIAVQHDSDDSGGEWTEVKGKRRRPSVPSSGARKWSALGAGTSRPGASTTEPGTSSAARVSSLTIAGAGPGAGRGIGQGPGHGIGAGGDTRSISPFSSVPVMQINFSGWQSPEKVVSGTSEDKRKRNQSLRQRSEEFVNHPLVKSLADMRKEYNPEDAEHQAVTLFHGTRSSNLVTFQKHGISPQFRLNEFSRGPCFYVANSLKTAFEHPLHIHPSFGKNPVIVFGFTVNTSILHGELAPPDGPPFVVKWFQCPDAEWKEFCHQNYCDSRDACHSKFDIVIGPVCIPTSKSLPDFEAVQVDGKVIQQIAFPTARGQRWLENHLSHAIQELRPE